MRNPILTVLIVLAAIFVVILVVRTQSATTYHLLSITAPPSTTISSPIEALDTCIQARFHTLTAFGMGRIPVVPQHLQWFKPETPAEKAAVTQLQHQGWKVALYLGGRGLLRSQMTKATWEKSGAYSFRRAISQPVFIAGQKDSTGLPQPWDLWKSGQKALASPKGNDSKGTIGKWFLYVRPVRANQKACLSCHAMEGATGNPPPKGVKSSLHVGDALGVAIYVYGRA